MRILTLVAVLGLIFGDGNDGLCYPVINQTGNLISNGNFETGQLTPWSFGHAYTMGVTNARSVDGQYSAQIDTSGALEGKTNSIGLYQYPYLIEGMTILPNETVTASAWFYPITGQAYIGLACCAGTSAVFSSPTDQTNSWQYLEVTGNAYGGGPLLYGLTNQDLFFVDGVWVNTGTNNLSPYAPQNGFTLPQPVPIPSAALLFGSGLVMVAGKLARHRRHGASK